MLRFQSLPRCTTLYCTSNSLAEKASAFVHHHAFMQQRPDALHRAVDVGLLHDADRGMTHGGVWHAATSIYQAVAPAPLNA